MAAIYPKPFNAEDKIYKRKYYSSPYIYADVDINQMADVDLNAFENLHEGLGLYSRNFESTVVVNQLEVVLGNFNVDIAFGGGTAKAYYNKVEFDIPYTTHVESTPGPLSSNTARKTFYLISTRETVTYGDDATIGGISGPGLAAPLASSDAFRYTNTRVDFGVAEALPTLSAGEEIIGVLLAITLERKPEIYFSTLPIGGNPGNWEPQLRIFAPDLSFEDEHLIDFGSVGYAPPTTGVWAALVKLKIDFSRLRTWLSDFADNVRSIIRDEQHTYARTQTLGYVSGVSTATNLISGTLWLPPGGNTFEVILHEVASVDGDALLISNIGFLSAPGAPVVSTQPTPVGTAITIIFKYQNGPRYVAPTYGGNSNDIASIQVGSGSGIISDYRNLNLVELQGGFQGPSFTDNDPLIKIYDGQHGNTNIGSVFSFIYTGTKWHLTAVDFKVQRIFMYDLIDRLFGLNGVANFSGYNEWIPLSLTQASDGFRTDWVVPFNAPYTSEPLSIRKNGLGVVTIDGVIACTSGGAQPGSSVLITTLTQPYRPLTEQVFPVYRAASVSGNNTTDRTEIGQTQILFRMVIKTNGEIRIPDYIEDVSGIHYRVSSASYNTIA